MASGITCEACHAGLSLDRDLLARRFLLPPGQRRLRVPDVLRAATDEISLFDDSGVELPALDYSRSVHQHLLACAGCLAITLADRPARADDVVPGRLSLAVPSGFVVRAVRRLESAAAAGRLDRELRTLAADPVRRYVARVPAAFRAARSGFADALMLTADVIAVPGALDARHAGPQGLVWDDGPRIAEGRQRLRRFVLRAAPALARDLSALPYQRGRVSVWHRRHQDGHSLRFGRGTRLPILGWDGAAFHTGPPRVQFDEHREQMRFESFLPPEGFVLPMDLAVPA